MRTDERLVPWRIVLVMLATLLLAGCGTDAPSLPPAQAESEAHDQADGDGDSAPDGHDDHGDADEGGHEGHGHPEDGEAEFAALTPAQAEAAGIVVATASTGQVDTGLLLTGNLVIDPRRMALVRARFPGLVRTMRKEAGESVARGEALASIESNESLTVYSVTAPIAGTVLERHVNAGDVSSDGPLYTIGDTGALQAELLVFPSSASAIRQGAPATILIGNHEIEGTVTALLPGLDPRTQARRARVTLTGSPPPGLAAGLFVTARLVAPMAPDTVVIPLKAVKQIGGRDVVFVPAESHGKPGFGIRPVLLGEKGRLRVAIRSGLSVGERFVSENAFLLKAEIGKHSAAHEH